MATAKKHLGLDEHYALGKELFEMRNRLGKLRIEISHSYGTSKRVSGLAAKTQAAVDALRCELDNIVCAEFPHENNLKLISIYYPGQSREELPSSG